MVDLGIKARACLKTNALICYTTLHILTWTRKCTGSLVPDLGEEKNRIHSEGSI